MQPVWLKIIHIRACVFFKSGFHKLNINHLFSYNSLVNRFLKGIIPVYQVKTFGCGYTPKVIDVKLPGAICNILIFMRQHILITRNLQHIKHKAACQFHIYVIPEKSLFNSPVKNLCII